MVRKKRERGCDYIEKRLDKLETIGHRQGLTEKQIKEWEKLEHELGHCKR